VGKLLPPSYFLASLVAVAVLHFLFPILAFQGLPWSLAGLVLVAAGVYLNLVADRLFKTHETTVKPFQESSSLVDAFPFSVSRNPMYLGMTAILLGIAFLLGTVGALVPALLFPVVMDFRFIRGEEEMMSATFGRAWDDYRARVRRWL
jgi:protein-S-isoprenylcysteine O-methyltransferase Ste14